MLAADFSPFPHHFLSRGERAAKGNSAAWILTPPSLGIESLKRVILITPVWKGAPRRWSQLDLGLEVLPGYMCRKYTVTHLAATYIQIVYQADAVVQKSLRRNIFPKYTQIPSIWCRRGSIFLSANYSDTWGNTSVARVSPCCHVLWEKRAKPVTINLLFKNTNRTRK